MLSTLQQIAILVTCFVLHAGGRRVQQPGTIAANERSSQKTVDHSARQISGRGSFMPADMLLTFLLGTNSAAASAFNSPLGPLGSSTQSAHLSANAASFRHSLLSLSEDDTSSEADPEAGSATKVMERPTLAVSEAGEELLKSYVDASEKPDELEALIKEDVKEKLGQAELRAIMMRAQSDESYKRIFETLQRLQHERMMQAKLMLEELLRTGDIQKLDANISQQVRSETLSPELISVLNKNIVAAMQDGDPNDNPRLNLLNHVSSRIQEELEKKQSPAKGLLHKIMRLDDYALRGRILAHHLKPQNEITTPDGRTIELKKPKEAEIKPKEFIEAVTEYVAQVRAVDASGDTISGLLEDVRQRVIQAHDVIVEVYPEDVVEEFRKDLEPVFVGVRPQRPDDSDEQPPVDSDGA